jgi:DNA-binding CsgD family transcriptional regulator
LRAPIEWTYRLLALSQQRLLCRLALVSGSFDVDTVEAMSRPASRVEAGDDLAALVEFHLVDPVPVTARLQLPFSVRAFGVQQLHECGEYESARDAHIAMRASEARPAAAGIALGDDARWLGELELDKDDLFAALDAAIAGEMVDYAIDLVLGLAPVWDMCGYHSAQQERVERTVKLARQFDRKNASVSEVLTWSALLGLRHGATVDPIELLDRLREAEALARAVHDDGALLRALTCQLIALPYSFDVAAAERASKEGLALAARVNHEHWRGMLEALSGMLAHQSGDDDRAIRFGRAAVVRARRVHDRRTLVLATLLLMPLRRRYPEIASAALGEEALRGAREARLTLYEGLLLQSLVSDAVFAGDLGAALDWATELLEFARTTPNSSVVGYLLLNIAHLSAACRDDEDAALLHGTIRDSLEVLNGHLAPQQIEAYEARFTPVRAALGDRFDVLVEQGARWMSQTALENAAAYVEGARARREREKLNVPTTTGPVLTNRQREVLRLIVAGCGNKEIAARLGVSPNTVRHHTTAIYRTLDVRDRTEATAVALRSGLVR